MMTKNDFYKKVISFVDPHINDFHNKRLESLKRLKLKSILRRKNPYLFKAKNIISAEELIRSFLDAHLSSQEEAIFGTFLEELVIFISSITNKGRKSNSPGIDLEFERDKIRYIVSIKSGPNWGNSSSIKKLVDYFNQAKRIAGTQVHIVAINGCCYGVDDNFNKKEGYQKLCGQRFWEFLTNDKELYIDIIEPIGYKAKEKNEAFLKEYPKVINKFTKEFLNEFCEDDGSINWSKVLKFNSGIIKNET